MSPQVAATAAEELRRTFTGPVHHLGSPDYDEQRLAPELGSPEPLLVAEATGVADVQAALGWARRHGIPFAVQSTGHGTIVGSDDGLLLKTARLATVMVDSDRRIATVGAGAQWGTVLSAATPFGLAPLCGNSADVGVIGYTLGGGVGWLAREFGYAADSVLRAELVTADGEHLTVTPDRHPDLFWAIRGGGGNFGVVTSLEFRLHPVHTVTAGSMVFPFERAAELLAAYGEWDEPRASSTTIILTRTGTAPMIALHVVHTGDLATARGALVPLLAAAGPPVFDNLAELTFPEVVLPGVHPTNFEMFQALSEPVIGGVLDVVRGGGPASAPPVEIRHWGGVLAEAGPGAGPVGHRDVPFSVSIEGPSAAMAALRPYATGGSFLNFTMNPGRTSTAYTVADHQRLREVKRSYDPENVFHRNRNITPAQAEDSAAAGGE